jgi:hypothetical protein
MSALIEFRKLGFGVEPFRQCDIGNLGIVDPFSEASQASQTSFIDLKTVPLVTTVARSAGISEKPHHCRCRRAVPV